MGFEMRPPPTDTGLQGPFGLATDIIDDEVVEGRAGAYAIGYIDNMGRFNITYVGSSHDNLNGRLKEHIGTAQFFKFRHLPTDRVAFEKECELFHDFRPRGNFLHPTRPDGTNWTCPRCRTVPLIR